MPSEAQLALLIKGDVQDVIKKLNQTEKEVSGLGKTLGDVGKIAAGVFTGGMLQQGASQLTGFLKDAAKMAAEDTASRERLNQAIENTGMSAQNASRWIDGLIKSGQDLGFTDDQTRDSLSLLTAQTGDAVEASKRYKLAQDLARGANIDVVTASKLLGKVTDENVNVLSRYGIAAKKGMTETELFGLVQEKFGGQAEKFANSTAGKMERLKDRMGELQETIGYAVLPVMTALADIALNGVVPAIEAVANVVGPVMEKAFGAIAPTIGKVRAGISGFARALRGGSASVSSFGTMTTKLSGPLGTAANIIRTVVPQAIAFLRQKFTELKAYWESDLQPALANVAKAFAAVAKFIIDNWQTLLPVIKPVLDQIILTVETAVAIIGNTLAIVIDLLQGDWAGAWKNAQDLIKAVWEFIRGTIGNEIELIKGIIDLGLDGIKALIGLAWDGIKLGLSAAWDGIKQLAADAWGGILNVIKANINLIIGAFNGLIRAWNGLELNMGGQDLGPFGHLPAVHVGTPDLPEVPYLARGGIVTGPMLAMIGDNRSGREAVIPLDEGMGLGPNVTIIVQGNILAERDIVRIVRDEILAGGFRGVLSGASV